MPHIGRALLLALLIASTQLRADGINNPASGGSGANVGFIEGVNNLGVGGSSGGGGCTGTIDLSTGCVLPMLGGL